MKKLFSFLSLVFLLTLAACDTYTGSGNIVTDTKTFPPFNAIEIGGPFETELSQGEQKVVIEADDNLMKHIKAEVKNNKLTVRIGRSNFRNTHLKLFISSPSVNSVAASSAAEIVIKGALKNSGRIELISSSGASVTGEVDAPDVMAKTSSGADLTVSGRTKTFDASASSGAHIQADNLMSETTDASASSGAELHVHASVTLNAKASSGGNISYRGGATVNQSISSGGGVSKE